jgi:transposase
MDSAALSLPNDPQKLKAEVAQLRDVVKEKERALTEKNQRIEQLLDYILLLRKRQFGRSSEASKYQINLFDEAELEALLEELELPAAPDEVPEPVPAQEARDRKKPVRRPLPAHFNRIEKRIDFSAEEQAAMGDNWTRIGYDTSEQLAVIPRQHYVIVTKRAKYVPRHDAVAGAERGVIIAPRAEQIIPKSIAHSSVIADVITRKFVDGLPFYRQETIYAREGVDLSRQTMSGWVIQLEEKLSPLMRLMKRQLYEGDVLHIDEPRLQVLNEAGRDNKQLSYIWVYVGGPPEKPVV